MNQTNLARWIEQAESRSVCELAQAEPGLFKVWATVSGARRTATEMRKTSLLGRLCHRRSPVERRRAAA
jgi:hypothetical protein